MPTDTRLLSKPGLLVASLFIAFVYYVQQQQQQSSGKGDGTSSSSSSSSSAFFFPFPFYVLFLGTIVGTGVVASRRSFFTREPSAPILP